MNENLKGKSVALDITIVMTRDQMFNPFCFPIKKNTNIAA